jgi:hypothetical protein
MVTIKPHGALLTLRIQVFNERLHKIVQTKALRALHVANASKHGSMRLFRTSTRRDRTLAKRVNRLSISEKCSSFHPKCSSFLEKRSSFQRDD